MSIHKKAVRGIFWQALNFSSIALVQILYFMLMTRLLPKDVHGRFAILNVLLMLISIFGQVGVSSALIQRKDIKDEDITFCLLSTILLSLTIYGVIYLLSPFISLFYKHEVTVSQILAISLTLIFTSVSLVPIALLIRAFQYKKIFIINAISLFIGYVLIGLGLAIYVKSIWSMIWTNVIFSFLQMILALFFNPLPLKSFKFTKNQKEIFLFGFDLTIIRLLSYIPSQIDKLIIGRITNPTFLGLWSRGQYISLIPGKYLGGIFDGVIFSYFSKMQDDSAMVNTVFLRLLSILTSFLLSVAAVCIIYSKEVVYFFLGSNWMETEVIISVLSLAIPLSIIARATDVVARSKATLKPSKIMKSIYIVLVIIASAIGSYYQSLKLLATLQLIAIFLYSILMLYLVSTILKIEFKKIIFGILDASKFAVFVTLSTFTFKIIFTYLFGSTHFVSMCSFGISIALIISVFFYYPNIIGEKNRKVLLMCASFLPQLKVIRAFKKVLEPK